MMMMDKNGRELKTGDVVRISHAFFANSNGLYFVEASPGDASWSGNDYSLLKICRNGRLSHGKNCVAFWPLISFCCDRDKNAVAWEWNRDHAEIEIIDTIDRSEVRAHFLKKADAMAETMENDAWRFGKDSWSYKRSETLYNHFVAVASGIA